MVVYRVALIDGWSRHLILLNSQCLYHLHLCYRLVIVTAIAAAAATATTFNIIRSIIFFFLKKLFLWYRCLGTVTKYQKAIVSIVMSLYLSTNPYVWNSLSPIA